MMRAKAHHDDMLKQKFAEEDEREMERKIGIAAMVEHHRIASLTATRQKQELMDKLAKARGRSALEKLSRDLAVGAAGCGSSTSSARPPPSSAREHLVELSGANGLGLGLSGSGKHGNSTTSLQSAPTTPRPPNTARQAGQPARPSTARARLA